MVALHDFIIKTFKILWCNLIKGGNFVKENKFAELSMDFSVDVINFVKYLKSNHESIISNQIGRSGTSIGANIREAHYAHGIAVFKVGFVFCYN